MEILSFYTEEPGPGITPCLCVSRWVGGSDHVKYKLKETNKEYTQDDWSWGNPQGLIQGHRTRDIHKIKGEKINKKKKQ